MRRALWPELLAGAGSAAWEWRHVRRAGKLMHVGVERWHVQRGGELMHAGTGGVAYAAQAS
jgi:hypothetical protein